MRFNRNIIRQIIWRLRSLSGRDEHAYREGFDSVDSANPYSPGSLAYRSWADGAVDKTRAAAQEW